MPLHTVDFERFPLAPGDRVLDIGCGEGRHAITAFLEEAVDAIAVDLNIQDLQTTRARLAECCDGREKGREFLVAAADGRQLPFADRSFDKVICSEVLEHIENYEAVLAEIVRVLKPGGLLAVSVPRFGPEWICWQLSADYHAVEGGHIRIFHAGELRRAVEATGLRFFQRHWAHALHVPYWWLRCLFWNRSPAPAVVEAYHRFLVWDLMQKPPVTYYLEKLLDPIMGKSVVMYFAKGLAPAEK